MEPVAARRAQVVFELQLCHKISFRVQDVTRVFATVYAQQDSDQSGHNGRIADGLKVQAAVFLSSDEPDLRLASADLIGVNLILFGERRQAPAKVDQVLLSIHPVVENAELVDDVLLRRVDFVSHDRRQVVPPGPSSILMPASCN